MGAFLTCLVLVAQFIKLMRKMNLDGGMSSFRAWYTYRAVRIGGASAARKTGKHRNPELRAP